MQAAQTRERRDAATFRKDRGQRPSVLCHSRLRRTGVFAQWRGSRLTPPEAHTTEDRASVAWLTRLSGVWRHTITSEQRIPELLLIPQRQPNFRCNCSARPQFESGRDPRFVGVWILRVFAGILTVRLNLEGRNVDFQRCTPISKRL